MQHFHFETKCNITLQGYSNSSQKVKLSTSKIYLHFGSDEETGDANKL